MLFKLPCRPVGHADAAPGQGDWIRQRRSSERASGLLLSGTSNFKLSSCSQLLFELISLVLTRLVMGVVQSMTLEEAQVLALKVLKQVMEEKLDHNNVQLAQVSWTQHGVLGLA